MEWGTRGSRTPLSTIAGPGPGTDSEPVYSMLVRPPHRRPPHRRPPHRRPPDVFVNVTLGPCYPRCTVSPLSANSVLPYGPLSSAWLTTVTVPAGRRKSLAKVRDKGILRRLAPPSVRQWTTVETPGSRAGTLLTRHTGTVAINTGILCSPLSTPPRLSLCPSSSLSLLHSVSTGSSTSLPSPARNDLGGSPRLLVPSYPATGRRETGS